MTVSSELNRKQYAGNGVTTSFATSPVVFFDSSDLDVYVVTTATGAATQLTETTDYTVSGGDGSTGTVSLAGLYGAPSASQTLVIVRNVPLTQEVDFVQNDSSDAEVQEDALDKLTMADQQLSARLDRSFTLADSDVSGASLTVPTPEANLLVGWNSSADGLENKVPADLDLAVVTPFIETLLDDTTAAAARTTLGAAQSVVTTKGDLYVGGAAGAESRKGVGADGQVVVADSTQSDGLRWAYPAVGRKNLLINHDGRINQRAAASGIADDTYDFDRWYALTQTGAIAVSQQTDVANGTPYMMRMTQSQASAQRMGRAQIIEAKDCKHLRGQSVTLQVKARISSSQALRYAILEWTGTADSVTSDVVNDWTSSTYTAGNFFLGSNLTVSAVGAQTPTANTLTTLASLTATLGSSFNNLIVLVWTEGTAAQNVTLDVSAQLEPGSAATDFEFPQYQTELARCHRFLFVRALSSGATERLGNGGTIANNQIECFCPIPLHMRASPSLSTSGTIGNLHGNDYVGDEALTSLTFSPASIGLACLVGQVAGTPFTAARAARIYCTGGDVSVLFSAEL